MVPLIITIKEEKGRPTMRTTRDAILTDHSLRGQQGIINRDRNQSLNPHKTP